MSNLNLKIMQTRHFLDHILFTGYDMYSKQNKIFIVYHFPLFLKSFHLDLIVLFQGDFFQLQTCFREAKRVILGWFIAVSFYRKIQPQIKLKHLALAKALVFFKVFLDSLLNPEQQSSLEAPENTVILLKTMPWTTQIF